MRKCMWALWPAFLVAIPASGIYFSLFDPADFDILGLRIAINRGVAYTVGFFAFWLLGAISSALSLFLALPRDRV